MLSSALMDWMPRPPCLVSCSAGQELFQPPPALEMEGGEEGRQPPDAARRPPARWCAEAIAAHAGLATWPTARRWAAGETAETAATAALQRQRHVVEVHERPTAGATANHEQRGQLDGCISLRMFA